MTKLLDQAIARVRTLPEEEQDAAAEVMLSIAARRDPPIQLDDVTREAIRQGQEQARRGEFASGRDVAAVFRRGT